VDFVAGTHEEGRGTTTILTMIDLVAVTRMEAKMATMTTRATQVAMRLRMAKMTSVTATAVKVSGAATKTTIAAGVVATVVVTVVVGRAPAPVEATFVSLA
jgi:hypothetical protein